MVRSLVGMARWPRLNTNEGRLVVQQHLRGRKSLKLAMHLLVNSNLYWPKFGEAYSKSDFKKIEDTVDKPLYDEMHQRLQTHKAKRMKKLRQSTVEPVIGTLVNFLGIRRVNTRGIQLAGKCLLMAAVCYNLKRLLKWTAEEGGKPTKRLANLLLMLWPIMRQQGRISHIAIAVSK